MQRQTQQQKRPAGIAASAAAGAATAATLTEGKRRRASGDTLEDPQWAKAWEAVLRKKAILKGLDQVFLLAQASDNFSLFGNDILQCFYDVATVRATARTTYPR
jgi:metal-dependent amidase/aminoacylase/carboxypeptidase family protein